MREFGQIQIVAAAGGDSCPDRHFGGADQRRAFQHDFAAYFGRGLVSLVCVYLILLFAESREWLGLDTNPELQAVEDTTATDEEAAASGTDAQAAADAGQDMSEPEAAEAPAEGFQPMQAASLEHMEVPSKT